MGWDSLESNSKKTENAANEGVISTAASRVAVRVHSARIEEPHDRQARFAAFLVLTE